MSGLKFKIDGRTVKIIAVAAVVLVASYAALYAYERYFAPITVLDYMGTNIEFRADLREAAKVPVYPGEDEVYRDTVHQLVKNVTIVFKDAGQSGNPYYIVEELEIASKMKLAYMTAFGTVDPQTGQTVPNTIPTFDVQQVSSYDALPGKIQNPIIAIIHPMFANDTAVRNSGHVTFISGTDLHQLDLAVDRFLMVELGISPTDLDA
ncbi:MAG: hypothetical protein NT016_02670 [Candidatus Aenigmarchaeota archaeon]|nr:hypothetical protein [Candidatus Aenigmarchaeota archaeon]